MLELILAIVAAVLIFKLLTKDKKNKNDKED